MHAQSWLVGVSVLAIAPALGARTPRDTASPVVTISAEELERSASSRNLADLLKTIPCGPQTVPTFTRPPASAPSAQGTLSCIRPLDLQMVEVLRVHNDTRAQFGSQPLVWDPVLAAAARDYAGHLARTGRLVHAPREGRGNSRENLSMGMTGWNGRQLMGTWLGERPKFRAGTYPNVSTTGRWEDVSHFTQMVWPTTVNLGCGTADGSGHRWLVCRYAPGGNRDGVVIAPGPLSPRLATIECRNQGGIMMCPEPEGGAQGGQPAGNGAPPPEQPQQPAQPGQAPPAEDNATRERPRPPAVTPDDGISRVTGNCGASVIAKVRITERADPRNPNKRLRTKESHNLSQGFSEIVIPFDWNATVEFRPDPDPKKTFPAPGRMDARWSIAGQPNPHTADITGGYEKLQTGKWDNQGGFMDVNPRNRPTVQEHSIFAEWNPEEPTNPDKCPTGHDFLVTFAADIPNPDALDLKNFVEQAAAARNPFPGTRPRTPFTTQTRVFHTAPPQPFSRPGYVLVPLGTYWDLPEDCCDIKRAKREVIQFARAAIEGPNGRQGKGWGLDVLPSELEKAKNGTHDPVYTGNPNNHGKDKPTADGAGGTNTLPGGDVLQWDAPGMPKDLFDRLHAAQGPSIYRQQFLSLLVCQKPGERNRVKPYLDHARVCQVAITTVRWDFPGQAGVEPVAPRPGAPAVMPYNQPRITISFDVRDGNCRPLQEFLQQNGFLDAFRNPSSDARKLEILHPDEYRPLNADLDNWETNPFADVRIQPRAQ